MWLAWIALGWAQTPQRVGIVEHAPIAEQSGIVQSVRWPGVYWVHNDSGGVARLFAISGSGEVLLPPWDADDYTVGPRARPGGRRPAWPGLIGVSATSADLYRLDTQHTDTVNVLTHVDHFDDLGGWVTGADLSPDGRTLALLVDAPASSVWLFPTPERGDAFSSGEARRIELDRSVTQQVEGLAWIDDRRLRITNEQRELYELTLE